MSSTSRTQDTHTQNYRKYTQRLNNITFTDNWVTEEIMKENKKI